MLKDHLFFFPTCINFDSTSDNHTELETGCALLQDCLMQGFSSRSVAYDNWNIMKNANTHREREEQTAMEAGRESRRREKERKEEDNILFLWTLLKGEQIRSDIPFFSRCAQLHFNTCIDVEAVNV